MRPRFTHSASRARAPDERLDVRSLVVRVLLVALIAVLAPTVAPSAAVAQDQDASQVFFPVQVTAQLQYSDSYGDCRSGCSRHHLGVDIMSPQMTPVFAAQSGTIFDADGNCETGESCYDYALLVRGDDGRMYFYVHLNNDTPGRPNGCDNTGGMQNAFAPALVDYYREHGTLEGMRVERGDHIGYVGSSGNAGCRVDHTHFEIWQGDGWSGHGWGEGSMDPYPIVKAAQDAGNVWGAEWPGVPTDRVAGADRIRTAIALSQGAFPDGAAQAVVIAPADQYQEALVGAPLAATLGGPVLLAYSPDEAGDGAVTPELATEIDRLGAQYAVIVGSPDRLGDDIVRQLAERTNLDADAIRRIGGATIGELSANVAKTVLQAHGITVPDDSGKSSAAAGDGSQQTVSPIVAAGSHPEGLGWPDALSASVLAARQVVPILLTPYDQLDPDVARVLSADGIGEVRIVGGSAAVSDDVAAEIEGLDRSVRRIAGPDRYATSLAIAAETLADGASLADVALATGLNFPDALASGPALAATGRPLVLVHRDVIVERVRTWLRDNAPQIGGLDVIGGVAAVSARIAQRMAVAANDPA